jgi:hypothetical protein
LISGPLCLALLGRHLAERGEQRRDRALLAERRHARGFKRRLVAGGLDGAHQFGFKCRNVRHVVLA